MTSSAAARRRVLRNLILERPVSSQSELVSLLARRGHAVTQATVSRDLQAIGAAKTDGDRYRLLDRGVHDEAIAHLARSIGEFVESIRSSGNLVVLRTPPGAAQVVAAAVDASRLEGVIGTVAGDDTVLVVSSEHVTGRGMAHKLEEIGASR
ncbi:MAG TPA: arginine repressor [Longimicrobiales bacterium]|nr:arginine repressor [Longimicrobiales bacterium]